MNKNNKNTQSCCIMLYTRHKSLHIDYFPFTCLVLHGHLCIFLSFSHKALSMFLQYFK